MRGVEIAIAKSLGLMGHYNKIKENLDDKLEFIEKIKKDRNEAQDFIKKLKDITQTITDKELEEIIIKSLTE